MVVMRQSMGFPSHRFLSPSINDLVMESQKDGPRGVGGEAGTGWILEENLSVLKFQCHGIFRLENEAASQVKLWGCKRVR